MIFDPSRLQKYRLTYLKLRAVSGTVRFYMLSLINNHGSLNVGKIVYLSKMEQPIVSQQLAILKKADLLVVEAQKKERIYRVNKLELERLISLVCQLNKVDNNDSPELKNSYPILLESYKYFKFLLHPGRLALVEILAKNGSSSVNDLARLSQQSQSIVSQNMKLLLDLDIVIRKQNGRKVDLILNQKQIGFLHRLIDK